MKRRTKWTKKDKELLKKTCEQYPRVWPKSLVERHGKAGCYTMAHRWGFTGNGIRNSGIDLRKLTIAEKAYMAGLIDADGSICFSKKKKTNPRVTIANTNKEVLEWAIDKFTKGHIGINHRKGTKNNLHGGYNKDVYQLHLTGVKNVYDVLRAIKPYMIIKRDKCEQTIEFLKEKYKL